MVVGIVALWAAGWIHGAQSPPDGHEDAGGGGLDGPGSILRGLGPGRGLGHHHLHRQIVAHAVTVPSSKKVAHAVTVPSS